MAKFSGNTVTIHHPADRVFEQLVHLERYQQYLDALPEDMRAQAGQIRFTDDSIVITAGPVGDIVLRKATVEAPRLMTLAAENAPVDMAVDITLEPQGDDTTLLTPVIRVDIPAMMLPFIQPKMKEAADKMGQLLASLFNAQ